MGIILQSDLEKFFPDLSNFGLTTINDCIASAETDVLNFLKYIWFPNAYSQYIAKNFDTNSALPVVPEMNVALLNNALIKNLIVYKTLGFYIFPSLMKTTVEEEDSFYARARYFEEKFDAELAIVSDAPIYDFNQDASFDNLDIIPGLVGRPKITLLRS